MIDLKKIPQGPGVYLMRDSSGKIIYIGKARNLRKRLASYVQKKDMGPKIHALLEALHSVEYVECSSEREALLFEQRWIKQYQPVFNAMWKDDKSYPYVVLTLQEDFPRLFLARRKHIPPGALAFGPYPSAGKVRALIRELFRSSILPLRPCRWDFSVKNPLSENIIHSCLYYHSGQCPAPCANKISRPKYRTLAKKAELLFSGKYSRLARELLKAMKEASRNLEFERAGKFKEHLEALSHIGENINVCAVFPEDLRSLYSPDLAIKSLGEALGLKHKPIHIEGFDISNISGAYPVGSMVCFINGKPNKSHYRHFKIRTLSGINDFAMMEEVVRRRYLKVKEMGEPMPDLILIDGGPGQLSAAKKGLGKLVQEVVLCSLAKEKETLFLDTHSGNAQARGALGQAPAAKNSIRKLDIAQSHEGLKLCMWIRDEAHRFAITYHKMLRRKGLFK